MTVQELATINMTSSQHYILCIINGLLPFQPKLIIKILKSQVPTVLYIDLCGEHSMIQTYK